MKVMVTQRQQLDVKTVWRVDGSHTLAQCCWWSWHSRCCVVTGFIRAGDVDSMILSYVSWSSLAALLVFARDIFFCIRSAWRLTCPSPAGSWMSCKTPALLPTVSCAHFRSFSYSLMNTLSPFSNSGSHYGVIILLCWRWMWRFTSGGPSDPQFWWWY